ncbi:MAG: C4-dicarboxylate transporter substrate-binding protein [Deltaproteobacteria bacterium]|jgi:TRAP transporter TAXI family solute receptor|nr:C4-dicarboxylate transporter substrate-binding protein [Deltaproteobacteria bacterium]
MRRLFLFAVISLFVFSFSTAWAQKAVRLSIATGGTGGVYYPLGGGMANVISKYIPYAEATAEVTTASVDNCLLVGQGKADLALIMADVGWDAYQGKGKFKGKIPLRTVAVLYPNNMHVVTTEGKGIEKVTDLKGKRVSTGAPGSGTEVKALRVLEAYGLTPDKDFTRDKLGVSESAGALKDRKIDAFFWDGGLPTAAVTDLGATPGIRIKIISHGDAIPKMREKYGPLYVKGVIPAKTYPGQDVDVEMAVVWNLLICNEKMKGDVAYDIIKTLFDRKPELVASHRDARFLALEPQVGGSPIPLHPGVIRYFTEKGVKVK